MSISSKDGPDGMDHANYTSYPKKMPMKHYKDLNETFNSQDPNIKGYTDRPHNATVDRLQHTDGFKKHPFPSPAGFRNTRTNATSGEFSSK
jgi:hypothetical protein